MKPSEVVLIVVPIFFLLSMLIFYFIQWRENKIFDEEVWRRGKSIFIGHFLRQWWIWLTHPVEQFLLDRHVTPNHLTMLSLVVGFFSGLSYAVGHVPLAGWLTFLAGFFDMLDGRIARRKNMGSKSGAFFDSFADRISEGIVYLGIIYLFKNSAFLTIISATTLLSSQLISYARARAEALGVECKIGWMQRVERLIYLSAASVFEPLFYYFTHDLLRVGRYIPLKLIMVFLAITTTITVYQRGVYVFKMLKKKED